MSRLHPIKDAGLALSLLTAIPTPATITEESRPQVAAWFPAVGAIFGFVGWGIVHGVERLHSGTRTSFLIAALIVLAWALLSRLLHWDGLADVADGFWGSHDRERRLEIMSDSHTGAFGTTAVALIALIEVAAIGAIIARPHELVVLLVPVISRFSATAGAWLGKPARPGGLGRSVIGHPERAERADRAGTACGRSRGDVGSDTDMPGLILAACGVIVALAVPHVLSSRFGGVTGDVMGASVLITETRPVRGVRAGSGVAA